MRREDDDGNDMGQDEQRLDEDWMRKKKMMGLTWVLRRKRPREDSMGRKDDETHLGAKNKTENKIG